MRVVPVKAASVTVAAVSCVMLTSLWGRAADDTSNKGRDVYLLKLGVTGHILNKVTQEIQVKAQDEFSISTTVENKQLIVQGVTHLDGHRMRVRLQVKSVNEPGEPLSTASTVDTNMLLTVGAEDVIVSRAGSKDVLTTNDGAVVRTEAKEKVITASVRKSSPVTLE